MPLATCIWALTCPEETALEQIAEAGFTHIDIRPSWLQSPDLQQRVKDLNLTISCMAASADMPEGASLAAANSYTGNVSLELKHTLPNPLDALKRSRAIVQATQP